MSSRFDEIRKWMRHKSYEDLTSEERHVRRFDEFIERGRGCRCSYDETPVPDRIRALRSMVDEYDVFAAVWPNHLSPNGYEIAFFKGESIAGTGGENTGEVRYGCIVTDSAEHAQGLIEAVAIRAF